MADIQKLEDGAESQAEVQSATPNEGVNESQNVETKPKEKNSAQEPMLPRRSKVYSTVPNEGVDLAIGKGELEGAEPITFGQLFHQRVHEFPNVAALKWKEKVGEGDSEESKMVWKTATYADYYKSCFNAAKSLLKVS